MDPAKQQTRGSSRFSQLTTSTTVTASKPLAVQSIIPTVASPTQTKLELYNNVESAIGGASNQMEPQPMPHSLVESKVIKNWQEGLKSRIENVNALAIVATFLAAVQAQLISFTYQNNSTRLANAANIFSFIGLAFDIIGTATGLISAMTLQPDNARIQDAVFQAEQSLSTWKELTDELNTISADEKVFQGRSMTKEMFTEMQQKQSTRRRRKAQLESQLQAWGSVEEKRIRELDELRIDVVVGNVKGFAPLMMMALGILCFFLALLCFVTSSQPKAVWISTLVGVILSACILPLDAYLHKWSPKKSTVTLLLKLLHTKRRRAKQASLPTNGDSQKTEVESPTTTKV